MIPIDLPPGVVSFAANKKKSANWSEVNLVRWEENTLRPIGGWEQMVYSSFASRNRAMHRWVANDGITYTAYLCEEHCYVEVSGELVDITPVDGIAPPPIAGAGGYGDLDFGSEDYGTPRSSRSRAVSYTPCYTLDNWGEELRVMTSADGRLLRWSPATPTDVLVAVTGAPTGNRSFCVTPERFIILFGADGDISKFRWCDQEDDTDWTVAIDSKAGEYIVEPRSPIVAHTKVGDNTLMLTNRGAYIIEYIGMPYIYRYRAISECATPFSAASILEIPDGAIWATINGFWVFNGTSIAPIDCPIWDWLIDGLNVNSTKYEACMVDVSTKSEVWFFFARGDEQVHPNRAAIYNYRDNIWYMSRIGRACGLSFPNEENPLMSDGVKVWKHEVGTIYPESAEKAWAETFVMNVIDGSNFMTIKQIVPEVVGTASALRFSFKKSFKRSPSVETQTPLRAIRSNGYVDVRETAVDFRLRVDAIAQGLWTVGQILVEAARRGPNK